MANKPKEAVQAQLNLIRKLKEEDCLSDYQIIKQLKIDSRTFYRYKKRIRNEKFDNNRVNNICSNFNVGVSVY